MAKSRLAGISAHCCVVPPLCALIQASRLIGRHCQCSRSLSIAACDGSLGFGPGQGSLGGKSGTSEQHGEQDTKHKAHEVIPSWLSGLPHMVAHGTDQLLLRSFRLGSPSQGDTIVSGQTRTLLGAKADVENIAAVHSQCRVIHGLAIRGRYPFLSAVHSNSGQTRARLDCPLSADSVEKGRRQSRLIASPDWRRARSAAQSALRPVLVGVRGSAWPISGGSELLLRGGTHRERHSVLVVEAGRG